MQKSASKKWSSGWREMNPGPAIGGLMSDACLNTRGVTTIPRNPTLSEERGSTGDI